MGHIFISYSHKDSAYVHKLTETLEKEGFEVWIDDRIHYGSEWPKVVTRNLDASDGVIVVLSNNSYESDMVQNEVTRAREKKKPIFPLLLNGENWLIVQTKQFVDVKDGSLPTEKFYKRLEEITSRKNERAEREAAEKAAQETAKREASEKAEQEKVQREVDKAVKDVQPSVSIIVRQLERKLFLLRLRNKLNKFSLYFRYYIFPAILLLGVVAATFYMAKPYFDNSLSSIPTATDGYPVSPQPGQTIVKTDTPNPAASETVTPTPLPTEITDAKGVSMVLVAADEFTMGSDSGDDEEKPVHLVFLDAYYIDKYEVTNALYWVCVNGGVCGLPKILDHYQNSQYAQHPVVWVNWNMASRYCEWRGARLPTEAEWEKAARGTDGRTYPWGNDFDAGIVNFCDSNCSYSWADKNSDDGYAWTSPVGSYPKGVSPYGAYDMAGNVWEWVADWYDAYPGNSVSNTNYGTNYRVVRGGAHLSNNNELRSAYRGWYLDAINGIGFRCAKSTSP